MVRKGGLILIFTWFFAGLLFLAPPAWAIEDHQFSALFLDGQGVPITTTLDVRLSLWNAYDVRSGDVAGDGSINTSALHYGGYQTTLSITPDDLGIFVFHTSTLVDFPQLSPFNSFLQLEHKSSGAPDTSYQIYDFINDPPQNVTRHQLDPHSVYYVNEAGPRTNWNTFTLDANNNAPTAISLQFGETLVKTLKYTLASGQFELNDDFVISGGLTATGTINFLAASVGIGTSTPQSALQVADGYYAQFSDNNAGAPPAADCDNDAEVGRVSIDTLNNRVYLCNGATRGWDYINLND